jgi:hypothetical protein
MRNYKPLTFWAGKKAYSKIKESGLRSADVKVMAGAAGGPKWLILNRLDRAMLKNWLLPRKSPLFFIGASIGAWRFAALCQNKGMDAIDRFEQAYIEQAYPDNPPPEIIDRELERILDALLGENGAGQILSNPFFRLNILAVRCRGLTESDHKLRLIPGLGLAAMANAMSRKGLRIFFERTLFYNSRNIPPIRRVPLDEKNLKPALMASGSIPMLMSGIENIPGAPLGIYRDGGIIDYHLNIDLMGKDQGVVLFPHYAEKLVPGWLDKHIFWRRPDFSAMDNVLMITPSAEFTASLPNGKIPDRHDFYTFAGDDSGRISYWKKVLDRGIELADDFMETVESGRIADRLRPISQIYKSPIKLKLAEPERKK